MSAASGNIRFHYLFRFEMAEGGGERKKGKEGKTKSAVFFFPGQGGCSPYTLRKGKRKGEKGGKKKEERKKGTNDDTSRAPGFPRGPWGGGGRKEIQYYFFPFSRLPGDALTELTDFFQEGEKKEGKEKKGEGAGGFLLLRTLA